MRYKVLLTGGNKGIISDFFKQLDKDFECLSSSTLYTDLVGHIGYFNPDVVAYCMNAESRDSMATMISVHHHMQKAGIPLVLICDYEDKDAYRQLRFSSFDLLLLKPITTMDIRDQLIYYLRTKTPTDKKPFPISLSGNVEVSDLELAENELLPEAAEASPSDSSPVKAAAEPETAPVSEIPEKVIKKEKKHILVIDDSTVMLRTINEHLKHNYEVATAINGRLARKYLKGKPVDLILLDYDMPEEDGPAVFQKLLNDPLTADIPVVFLTGINNSQKIQRALLLKPAGYILKPVDKNTLLMKVQEIIG